MMLVLFITENVNHAKHIICQHQLYVFVLPAPSNTFSHIHKQTIGIVMFKLIIREFLLVSYECNGQWKSDQTD